MEYMQNTLEVKGNTYNRVGPWIYVACLAAYNNGRLHGRWIHAATDVENIREEVQEMLKQSPEPDAEEWAIHDDEGFEGIRIAEWDSFDKVSEIAIALQEADDANLLAEVYNHLNIDSIEDSKEFIEQNYAGSHKDIGEFAHNLCDECGDLENLPKQFAYYIDFDRMGRDMELNGDIFTVCLSGELHVFWNR